MKVKRVVINEGQLHAGVVFDTGPNTVGRAIVDLPADACAAILAAAQSAFDKGASDVAEEVQSTALTAELHRIRSARQDLDIVKRDHAAAIDEHGKRIADARQTAERDQMQAFASIDAELARRREEAATIAAGLATNLDNQRKAIADADKEIGERQAAKAALEKDLAELERSKRLTAITGVTR